MKYLIPISLICSLILLAGCDDFFETTLPLEAPEHTPKLVVSCVINDTDEYIAATVTRTTGLLEEDLSFEQRYVKGAEVQIFRDGALFVQLDSIAFPNAGPNYITLLPEPVRSYGSTMEIRVSHPDFTTASGTAVFPEPIIPSRAVYDNFVGVDEFGEAAPGVEVTLQDPAGEDNYYEALLLIRDTIFNSTFTEPLFSADPATDEGLAFETVLVRDALFDGQEYTVGLGAFIDWVFELNQQEPQYIATIQWSTVTEGVCSFSRSAELQLDIGDNPFAEPVTLFSNIENGEGFFGCRTMVEIVVEGE